MKYHVLFLILMSALLAAERCRAADASSKPQKPASSQDALNNSPLPADVGQIDPDFWKTLTEDQQEEAVAALKKLADRSCQTLKKKNLRLVESRQFLTYSDLPTGDANKYDMLLERMYGKLAELFAVDRSPTVWRGKALVYIFSRIEDYRLYERLIESTDPGGSYGMTHCYGDGMVHIAFYRCPDDTEMSHLLVHECVHGFLHRYRSPVRVPSWANEGLAEVLASDLIPDTARAHALPQLLKTQLSKHGNAVGDFFTSRQIDGWQYPLAESLCSWMIRHDRKAYVDFINGVKDGQTWDDSLKKNYKLTKDRLIAEYAKSANIRSLRS